MLNYFHYSPNFVLLFLIIYLPFNKSTKFSDTQKQLPNTEMPHSNNKYQVYPSFLLNLILINDSSEYFFGSPKLLKRLSYIQLFLLPTEKLFSIFNMLMEDVNKTISKQGYNIVKSRENKKDKNGDFQKGWLGYSKRKVYKDEEEIP